MKKILHFIILISLMLTLIAADSPELGFLLQSVDVNNFPSLELRLSVWDANGLPLDSLSADNFALETSNGVQLKPHTFKFTDSGTINIALVLDISGSMAGQALNDAKAASYRFLDRLTEGDQAALIAFSDKVSLYKNQFNPERELDFSPDLEKVYDTIEALNAKGGTELYNAVYKAVDLTSALPQAHRAVLLFSDGRNDSAIYSDPEAAITLAKDEGIPIFVIGLGSAIDRDYLQRLADETGGVARFTPRSSELAQVFDDMARLLKGQYLLSYELPEPVTQPHETLQFSLALAGDSAVQEIVLVDLPVSPVEPEPAEIGSQETEESLAVQPESIDAAENIGDTQKSAQETIIYPGQNPDDGLMAPEKVVEGQGVLKTIDWYWWVLAGLLLLVLLILIIRRARKANKKPAIRTCMRCGYRLTKDELVCPQCGEKRIKTS